MRWRPILGIMALLVILALHVAPVLAEDCGCGGDSGSGDAGDSSDGDSSSGYGSSQDPAAMAATAQDLYMSGHYFEALQAFNDSLAIDPYNAPALMGKAEVLFTLRQYPEAAETYRKVVTISPGHDRAYFCLGNTYLVMGEYQEAAEAYERSLGIRPGNTLAEENLRVARSFMMERVPTEVPTIGISVAPEHETVQATMPLTSIQPTDPTTAHSAPMLDGWTGVLSLILSVTIAIAGMKKRTNGA